MNERIADSRTVALTAMALVAFAANSVLCRMALSQGGVDAATYATIRVLSGAAMLLIVSARSGRPVLPMAGSWTDAGVLAIYSVPFAVAYTQLSTGTGALILFGCVQVTMLAAAFGSGEAPRAVQLAGAAVALAGLVTLVLPGLTAPPPLAALLMAIAGVCWGLYSLRGRGTSDPLSHTTGNFVRTVPLVGAASLFLLTRAHVEARGVILSVASGAIASGLGYVAWYGALRGLSATHASVVQLAVPLLAAAAGVVLLAEAVSVRLVVSTILVLGGIALAIVGGRKSSRRVDEPPASPALSRRR